MGCYEIQWNVMKSHGTSQNVTSKTHHWVSAEASGHERSSYGLWADISRASRYISPPGSLIAPQGFVSQFNTSLISPIPILRVSQFESFILLSDDSRRRRQFSLDPKQHCSRIVDMPPKARTTKVAMNARAATNEVPDSQQIQAHPTVTPSDGNASDYEPEPEGQRRHQAQVKDPVRG
jgi:hypothetical protein